MRENTLMKFLAFVNANIIVIGCGVLLLLSLLRFVITEEKSVNLPQIILPFVYFNKLN